ncbi:hypothetical protein RRG08_001004 [Elysia crispata]|uniref:C-type lectin domain-containing protein n=1 Tax=Elysia crispata TaxID=231223 RepID=A0AAE1AVV8_9GAST|nr:hypothetical protein RRG08_001004 [Elysia crispata]
MHSVILVFVVLLAISVVGVCPPGWAQRDRSCYFLFDQPVGREQAAQLCASHSATLVSYKDKEEWTYLSNLEHSTQLQVGAWTDLVFTQSKTWKWENSKDPFVKLSNWYMNGHISGAPTSTVAKKVVKRDIDSRDLCDISNGWFKLHIRCYKRFRPDNWKGAISLCLAEQGQMFSPSNQKELDSAASMFDLGTGMWVDVTTDDVSVIH